MTCDHCHQELNLLKQGSVAWEGKVYHVACWKRLKEENEKANRPTYWT